MKRATSTRWEGSGHWRWGAGGERGREHPLLPSLPTAGHKGWADPVQVKKNIQLLLKFRHCLFILSCIFVWGGVRSWSLDFSWVFELWNKQRIPRLKNTRFTLLRLFLLPNKEGLRFWPTSSVSFSQKHLFVLLLWDLMIVYLHLRFCHSLFMYFLANCPFSAVANLFVC